MVPDGEREGGNDREDSASVHDVHGLPSVKKPNSTALAARPSDRPSV